MSLINTMLRDLDARHAAGVQATLPENVRSPRQPVVPRRSRGRWLWPIVALAIVAIALLQTTGYWLPSLKAYQLSLFAPQSQPLPVTAQQPPASVVPQPLPIETAAVVRDPSSGADVPVASPQPDVSTPPAPQLRTAPASQDPAGGLRMDSSLAQTPAAPTTPTTPLASVAKPRAPAPHKAKASITKPAANHTPNKVVTQSQPPVTARYAAEEAYRRGVTAYKLGHLSEAISEFKSALRDDPRHVAARQTLLSLLVDQKRWDEAHALLSDGLDLMPTQIPWAMAMARIAVERGHAEEAWAILQKYMASGEKNADYQGFAGVLLQRLKKPREAAAHYRAALQLSPNDARWWLGLGLALEADGQAAEARSAFQRARGTPGLTADMAAVIETKLR
jgi:MSHA biogenesis protein MshN